MKHFRLSVDSGHVGKLFITRPTVTYSSINAASFCLNRLTLADVNCKGNVVNIFQGGGPIRFAVPRASGQVKTALILTGWMPFLSPNQQCQSSE